MTCWYDSFFMAMLDAWGRSDVKVLLRSDQEVTLTLILREVQARRQQRTLVERSQGKSRYHGESKPHPGRDVTHNESTRLKRELEAGWRRTIQSSAAWCDIAGGSSAGTTWCFRTTVAEADLPVLAESSGLGYPEQDCCVASFR